MCHPQSLIKTRKVGLERQLRQRIKTSVCSLGVGSKLGVVTSICKLSAGEAEPGRSLGSLARQPHRISEFQAKVKNPISKTQAAYAFMNSGSAWST